MKNAKVRKKGNLFRNSATAIRICRIRAERRASESASFSPEPFPAPGLSLPICTVSPAGNSVFFHRKHPVRIRLPCPYCFSSGNPKISKKYGKMRSIFLEVKGHPALVEVQRRNAGRAQHEIPARSGSIPSVTRTFPLEKFESSGRLHQDGRMRMHSSRGQGPSGPWRDPAAKRWAYTARNPPPGAVQSPQ